MEEFRNKSYSVSDICNVLKEDYQILGESENVITHPAPINSADRMSISFCVLGREEAFSARSTVSFCEDEVPPLLERIEKSFASVVICPKGVDYPARLYRTKLLVLTENPRFTFINIVERLFSAKQTPGIHQSAIISDKAEIDDSCYIGPFTFIGDNCKVREKTIVHGNTFIYPNTTIGSNTIIHSGVAIGADGFGFWRKASGDLIKFPHIGGVIIGDFVEVGSNVSIDRGTLANTIIGDGTKIDNLVHISPNVRIGKHCAIIARSMVGGSVVVEDSCWIGPAVTIRDRLKIGKQSIIGMTSVVTESVPDGSIMIGSPAKSILEYKKQLAVLDKLMKKKADGDEA